MTLLKDVFVLSGAGVGAEVWCTPTPFPFPRRRLGMTQFGMAGRLKAVMPPFYATAQNALVTRFRITPKPMR